MSIEKEIIWRLCEIGVSSLEEGGKNYSYKEVSDIPVMAYTQMDLDSHTSHDTKAFIEEAAALRNQDVAILDLRGNGGGHPYVNLMWLYQITGKTIYPRELEVVYKSQIVEYSKIFSLLHSQVEDFELNIEGFEPDFYNEFKPNYQGETEKDYVVEYAEHQEWVENETLWFVLVDKGVCSAGEMLLSQMKNMSNVIIVGTNSNGCLTTGLSLYNTPLYLPNSKQQIIYSISMVLTDETEGYDARGTLPDLYIANEDALDAVVRCYEYYKDTL